MDQDAVKKSREELAEAMCKDRPPEIQACIRKAILSAEDPSKLREAISELPANLHVNTLDLAHFSLMSDPQNALDGFGAMVDEAQCAMMTLGRMHEYAGSIKDREHSGLSEDELTQFAWIRATVGIFTTRCIRAAAVERGAPPEVLADMDAKLKQAELAQESMARAAAVAFIGAMRERMAEGRQGDSKRRGDRNPFDGSGGNYL